MEYVLQPVWCPDRLSCDRKIEKLRRCGYAIDQIREFNDGDYVILFHKESQKE